VSHGDIRGGITDWGEPVIELEVIGCDDPVLVLIDTGFNREVFLLEAERIALGLAPKSSNYVRDSNVYVADGKVPQEHTYETVAKVRWFGAVLDVAVLVFNPPQSRGSQASRQEKHDYRAVIGWGLLRQCVMTIDYPAKTVTLSRQAPLI